MQAGAAEDGHEGGPDEAVHRTNDFEEPSEELSEGFDLDIGEAPQEIRDEAMAPGEASTDAVRDAEDRGSRDEEPGRSDAFRSRDEDRPAFEREADRHEFLGERSDVEQWSEAPAAEPDQPGSRAAESEAAPPQPAEAAEEAKPKRGRGRRASTGGTRARRKPTKPSEETTPASEQAAGEANEDAATPQTADAGDVAAAPKRGGGRRRGTRGGRGRKKATDAASSSATAPAPVVASGAEASQADAAVSSAPRRSGKVAADKHLADDEPVEHEPVRRPRSYRDLDQIPEEYD